MSKLKDFIYSKLNFSENLSSLDARNEFLCNKKTNKFGKKLNKTLTLVKKSQNSIFRKTQPPKLKKRACFNLKAFKVITKKSFQTAQERKQKTLNTLGDYVASMVLDGQEYLLQKLGVQTAKQSTSVAEEGNAASKAIVADPRPPFVRRQAKFVRKVDIDRTTRVCVSSIRGTLQSSYISVKDGKPISFP